MHADFLETQQAAIVVAREALWAAMTDLRWAAGYIFEANRELGRNDAVPDLNYRAERCGCALEALEQQGGRNRESMRTLKVRVMGSICDRLGQAAESIGVSEAVLTQMALGSLLDEIESGAFE